MRAIDPAGRGFSPAVKNGVGSFPLARILRKPSATTPGSRGGLAFAVLARRLLRFRKSLLRRFMRLVSMLHRLPREFVSGQMIFLSVMRRGRAVRMRRHLMEFRSACVVTVRHKSSVFISNN
ncbi:MAG TPA: hypothetical protein VK737_05605 [Opitutales bacterium]|nr:hypothetical protein [Opitutales bacterium]